MGRHAAHVSRNYFFTFEKPTNPHCEKVKDPLYKKKSHELEKVAEALEKGGSIELGKASTNAVVYSNILILLSDYLIAVILTA